MKWKRNGLLIEEPIMEYLSKVFDEEIGKGHKIEVKIGTDSQKSGKQYKFATIILITTREDLGGGTTVGRGGIIISTTYYHTFKKKNKDLVNERMVFEVGKSVEVAYEIATLLDDYGIKLEIHADINPNPKYESNKALQTAIGYILGMGYEFKIKPLAPAASNAADRFC